MAKAWIVGRLATIASNGHEYITEPYIVFDDEPVAEQARKMIQDISGERIGIREAVHYEHRARHPKGQ